MNASQCDVNISVCNFQHSNKYIISSLRKKKIIVYVCVYLIFHITDYISEHGINI